MHLSHTPPNEQRRCTQFVLYIYTTYRLGDRRLYTLPAIIHSSPLHMQSGLQARLGALERRKIIYARLISACARVVAENSACYCGASVSEEVVRYG